MQDRRDRPALIASMSLLAFSALNAVALIAFFRDAEQPVGWRSILALGVTATSVVASALLWRVPTRTNAMISGLLMLASLARLGPFSEWTQVSYLLIAITFVFMAPVVFAIVRLRD